MKRFSLALRRLLAATCLLMTAIPVSAATPSQQLDKAIKSVNTWTSYSTDVQFNMDFSERVIGKANDTLKGNVLVRTHVSVVDKTNGEGRLSIDRLSMSGDSVLQTIQLDSPIVFEWKLVGTMAYFRLTDAPATLVTTLKNELGFDIAPLIGIWIGIDTKNDANLNELPLGSITALNQEIPKGLTTVPAIKNIQWFQVMRTEKTWKNAAGQDVVRLRVRLNPLLINALQREEIRRLPRGRYYAEDLKALNKRYTDLRVNLAKIGMVVNLNTTLGHIERMEAGGLITEPRQSCTYNARTKKDVCRNTSISSFKLAIGIDVRPESNLVIIPPAVWKTIEEISKMIEDMTTPPPTATSTDMTETLTAP